MEVGSCVICTQNLCISNFSSLPCGHTFHYNCIRRWLVQSQQCPTCRAESTPMNIVKRLYFANCIDKALNDSKTSGTDSDTKSKKMDKCDVGHRNGGNDENCNNNSDSEDEEVDSDFTGSDDDSSMSSSESEDLDYHDSSDADMTSLLEASVSDTSSVSLGTFSDAVSETDAVNHDNMETSNSFNDHEEVGNDHNNYTSILRIERVSDDGDDGDDDDTSDDEDSSKSDDSDNGESQEYSRLLNHFTFELRVLNRNIS
uniref:RING-type domain-containing protein n=1 Tax=Wuchereria bancrofti TaxID=6293 RepID=A0AAF5PNF7_WUCBA